MLVLEPKKRYNMKQIMQHKWMMMTSEDKIAQQTTASQQQQKQTSMQNKQNGGGGGGSGEGHNEQILRLMKGLGIDQRKTIEVS